MHSPRRVESPWGEMGERDVGLKVPQACPSLAHRFCFLCLLYLLPHPPCSQVSHLPLVSENDPHPHISLAPPPGSCPPPPALLWRSPFQPSVKALLRCCQRLFSKKFLRAGTPCFHLRTPYLTPARPCGVGCFNDGKHPQVQSDSQPSQGPPN